MMGGQRVRVSSAAAFLVVLAACSGGESDETTTTVGSTTTSSTTTTTIAVTTTTTIPAIENGPAIAHIGDRSEVVLALQFLMNCNDYGPLDVDGAFGPATGTEVETLQSDLGREPTGEPDEETFALLARGCDDSRRVIFGDGETESVVVGNVASGDSDRYFVRAVEDQRMTLTAVAESGAVSVNVTGADGAAFDEPPGTVWSGVLPSTQDYLIDVGTEGEAVRYQLTIAIPALPDRDEIDAAPDDAVVVDGEEHAVVSVCVDTSGAEAYAIETAAGHLVVASDSVGTYGFELGGIGAPVEFIYRDGSPGFFGFGDDLVVATTDGVISGESLVFLPGPGNTDEPFDLAFSFSPSVVPCSGDAATSIVLRNDGLGVVDFGAPDAETIAVVQASLPTASPALDSGWVEIAGESATLGSCADDVTEIRIVTIDNLALYFINGPSSFAPGGTRHFAGWEAVTGPFPFSTVVGSGLGDSVAAFGRAHPDAFVDDGGDGAVVYVTSPPGADSWLRAFSSGAEIDRLVGGRVCSS